MKSGAAHNRLRRKYFTLLIIVGILLYISSQNTQTVTVNFLFWSTSLSLILLLYITFIIGVASGLLFKSINRYVSERMEKKLESNEDEPSDVKKIPQKKTLLKIFAKKERKKWQPVKTARWCNGQIILGVKW